MYVCVCRRVRVCEYVCMCEHLCVCVSVRMWEVSIGVWAVYVCECA